jgi:hypothetical protein
MILRVLRAGASLFVYACVATVIAQAVLLLHFGRQWHLDRDSVTQILAIAYGIDLFGVKEEAQRQQDQVAPEQASYEQILEARALKSRNLELREQALQAGLNQFRFEQTKLAEDQKQHKQLKESFEAQLRSLREGATATGAEEVRRILEALKPKQSKELLVQMLEDKKLDEAVTLLAAMPDAKRAKIIGEFKTPEETEKIGEVLRRIRQGAATADAVNETRKKIEQPKPAGSS